MKLCIAAVLALAPAGVAAALATVVKPMFFSEIVAKSDLIFLGTVTASESRHEEGRNTIRTYVTLKNLSLQKGAVEGDSVTLRFEGGAVGDDRLVISDMPQLAVGGRYLLYVTGNGTALSPITGFNQGAFEILVENGREVLRNTHGLELMGVRDDRLVFAAKPQPVQKIDGPAVGAGEFKVKPADANVEAIEAEMVRRLQAQGANNFPPVELNPPAGVPANSVGAQPPVPSRTALSAPAAEATPILVPVKEDTGVRMSLTSILTQSARVR